MFKIKYVARVLCVLFIVNLFIADLKPSATSYSSNGAIGNVDIISDVDVSVESVEAWARSKNATETFVSLAKIYKQYGQARGGVNWVLAYVQAAKETGYGRFGGVLDESYHNPCGLKIPSGGDDYDPNAHKRFDNWEQGVIAHLDHLALYAGANGYPKTVYVESWKDEGLAANETYDPRHIGWFGTTSGILGKATNAIDLGAKWAPSSSYGVELFRLYCDAVKANYLEAKSNLESPANGTVITDGKLNITGWALHAFGIKEVRVLLDNTQIDTISVNGSRPDVNSTYPGYYNGSNSGFNKTIDISNLGDGNKNLEVIVVANDNSTQSYKRTIVVKSTLDSKSSLESLSDNAIVKSDTINISGWALASSGVKEVRVYVDGKDLGTVTYGTKRTDVNNAYPGYPSGDNAGFEGNIDISSIGSGSKKLVVKITANDGTTQSIERTINYRKKSLVVIDPGHENTGGDPGASATHNGITYIESNLNLQIAVRLKAQLEAKGIEVYMTRYEGSGLISTDSTESLKKRVTVANEMNADFFVSIHHNSFTSESANGFEVYYSTGTPITTTIAKTSITEDGRDLTLERSAYSTRSNTEKVQISKSVATQITNEVSSKLSMYNRGAKDSNLYVCKNTLMPSILVENGFLTNPTEAAKVSTASHQQKLAEIIAEKVEAVLQ